MTKKCTDLIKRFDFGEKEDGILNNNKQTKRGKSKNEKTVESKNVKQSRKGTSMLKKKKK